MATHTAHMAHPLAWRWLARVDRWVHFRLRPADLFPPSVSWAEEAVEVDLVVLAVSHSTGLEVPWWQPNYQTHSSAIQGLPTQL